MGKLDRICDIGIEVCILAVLLATPGLWNPWGLNAYELPKVCFLRVMVVAGMALWGVKVFTVHGSRFTVQTGQNGQAGRTGCPRPLLMAVLAFTGAQVLSCLLSLHRYTSLFGTLDRQQGCYTMLCYVGFFFLLCSHLSGASSDSGRAWRVLVAAVLGSVWVCAAGLAEGLRAPRFKSMGPPPSFPRIGSTLGNPIFLGAYLVLVIPLTADRFWRLMRSTSQVARYWGCGALALLAVQLICLFLTGSRGPWAGLAAATAFLAVVLGLRWRAWRWVGAAGGVVLLLAALFVAMNTENPLRTALSHVPYLGRLGFVDEMQRGAGQSRVRPLVWKATLQLLTTPPSVGLEPDPLRLVRPWVGWGQDMMAFAFQSVFPARLEDHGPGRRLVVDRAHNVFLDTAVAMGLVGLAAYVGVVVTGFWVGLRRLWRTEDRGEQLLLAFALAALFGHLVEAQFGIVLTSAQTLFWLALALVAANMRSDAPTAQRQEQPVRPDGRVRTMGAAVLGALVVAVATYHAAIQVTANALASDVRPTRRGAVERTDAERLARLDRAIRLAPLESQYRFLSGLVCSWTAGGTPAGEFKVKLLAESERALQSAIVLQPFYANYYAAAGGVYRSWALKMDQSKLGAALGCYEKALRISPYNVDIRNEFADLLYHANRREEAAAQLENSASIDPGYWSTLYLLTRSLVELGRQERARYWLAEAVRADPEVWDIADDLRRQYKLQEHQ